MADRPILFSAPMVRAILREIEKPGAGKTQTRRILRDDHVYDDIASEAAEDFELRGWATFSRGEELCAAKVPYVVGDRLWVRESLERANGEAVGYPADLTWLPNTPWEWKRDRLPSIHMPRRLSRITLIVTGVRVERLQDISRDDAIAEGLSLVSDNIEQFWRWPEPHHEQLWLSPVAAYQALWDRLNAARGYGWEANPWVVVITFRPVLANIDSVEALAA